MPCRPGRSPIRFFDTILNNALALRASHERGTSSSPLNDTENKGESSFGPLNNTEKEGGTSIFLIVCPFLDEVQESTSHAQCKENRIFVLQALPCPAAAAKELFSAARGLELSNSCNVHGLPSARRENLPRNGIAVAIPPLAEKAPGCTCRGFSTARRYSRAQQI